MGHPSQRIRTGSTENISVTEEELARRVDKTWIDVMRPNMGLYYSIIDELFSRYPHNNDSGFYYNVVGNKHTRVYPAFEEVLRPFRDSRFDNIKAIIVWGEPMDNGYSKGYPWIYRSDEPLTMPNPVDHTGEILWFSKSLELLQYLCKPFRKNKPFENKDSIQRADVDKECTNIDPILWLDQGVLCLYSAFTVEENNPYTHVDIWASFVSNLLDTIREHKIEIPILGLGNEACDILRSMRDIKNNLLWEYDLEGDYTSQDLSLGNPFILLNNRLEEIGQKAIDW